MPTLFNHPPSSARTAKPWQSTARLAPEHTRHGFASTSWLQPEGASFAEGGFQPKSAGFAQDRYQTVSMPLSEKSKTSLQLMGEGDGSDDFSANDLQRREPESPNAHLPFVMDVYGVKPVTAKAPPTVMAEETQAQENAQTADVNTAHEDASELDIQADDLHPQEVDQVKAAEETLSDTQVNLEAVDAASEEADAQPEQAEASDELEAQQEAESEPHLEPEQSTQPEQVAPPEPDLVESELITHDSVDEPQSLGAEVDELLAQAPVPSVTVVGIDPDEVAQREAAQFAQGLAQGIEQGERQARDAMQQEVAAQCAVLSAVTHDLNALLQDPKKFFEPLKRLALHVAEHLVMKELSTSTEAIERLVQRCLDELDHPAKGAVVVELNPQDKERLQAQDSALVAGMRLDAVQGMKPGSVRVFANDTVVEDLVEHRLEALARSLLVDVEDWRAKSTLAQPEVETSEPEVEDVEPNDVHP